MGLIRLKDYIEPTDVRNNELLFSNSDLKGLSISKSLINTKANTSNLNLSNYKVLKHNEFVYCTVTSRNGNKISLAYNDGDDCIISSINPTFKIKDENKLNPRFLMMFFNRAEFDRYARFNSWGSARETFTWEDMCDIELDLPPIEIQRKYVAIYEGLLANLKVYESKLEDLKLVCDGYIEGLKRKYPSIKISDYIFEKNLKNDDEKIKYAVGISVNGVFNSKRTSNKDSIASCKVLCRNDIFYASQTTCGIGIGAVGIYDKQENAICAPTCIVVGTKDDLNPYYLLLWINRKEFWRYANFVGSGVVEKFDFALLKEVKIPIPPLEIQNSIVEVFKVYNKRKETVIKLKNIIKNICPLLVRGAILEGKKDNEYLFDENKGKVY